MGNTLADLSALCPVLIAADLADYRADREDRQAKSILDGHFASQAANRRAKDAHL